VFHKPVGVSLTAMGVKSKTFNALRHFRAGIEGNIFGVEKGLRSRESEVERSRWLQGVCLGLGSEL